MVAALRSLLVATALLAVFANTATAQDPACDRTWNGTTGNWGDASRWSGGAVPGGNDRACLPNGAYTVIWTGSATPKGVTVGTGAILVVKEFQGLDARSSSLVNHGTVRLEQGATLFGPLVNDGTVEDTGTIAGNSRPNINGSIDNSGTIRANQGLNLNRQDGAIASTGKLETANADALINATGYPDGTITLSGTVTNPGTMQFQAGTLRVRAITTPSGNPVRTYQSKLDLTGATGTVETMQTVDLVTDIPAAATVRVTGRSDDANLRLDADHTNHGTLVFDSTDQNRSTALSTINTAVRLTNAGTLRVTGTTGADRNIRIPIANTATGTMTVDAGNRMVFQNDAGETTTAGTWNVNGNVWVQGGSTAPAQITQTGGTITIANGVSLFVTNQGRFVHQGGTSTGELQLQNGSTLGASGPGAATYHVAGYVTLAGNVNAASTINVEAAGGQPGNLTLASPSTMAGRLTFTTGGANAQDTEVNGGQRLTVTGRIDVLRGQGGTRHFKVPLTIAAGGQFNVEALSTALLDGNDTLTHQIAGTLTVAGGAYFGVRSGTQTVTQTGGTINGAGAFSIENLNTFDHQGGTVPGELQLQNGAVLDPSGAGAASYHVVGNATLAGDVNADATITADANTFTPAQLTLAAPRTVAGRIVFTTTGANAQDTLVNGPGRLTVTGRIDVQKGAGGIRHFNLPLTVAAGGQFNVGADASVYVNGNGNTLDHQIAGNVSVANGGLLLFRIAAQTVTQTAGTITAAGTLNVEGNAFVHRGGNVVGRITVSSSNVRGRLDPSGPGTAAYVIVNSVNLIGDVSADAEFDLGTNTVGGQIYVPERDVTNQGTIQVGQEGSPYGSTLSDDGQPYVLTNAGSITAAKGTGHTLNLRVVNTGTLTVNDAFGGIASSADKPLVTNSGGTVTINKTSLTTWRGYTQTSGLTDIIDGSLGSPRPPADIQILGGRLRGTGVLYGPVTNGATIEVGRAGAYGRLAINDVVDQIVRVAASYTQTATGRLAVDVGGTVAGTSFDQLTVQGPASLNGAIDLSTAAGYTPNPATPDKYRVLLSETRANSFAGASGSRPYSIGYDATGVELTARVPPAASAELSISDTSVVEGAGPLTFTVKLDKPATDVVSVDWYTEDDSATAPGDYTAGTGTVTFPAGSTSQTFTVPVTNDALVEPSKELVVRLRNPVNAIFEYPTAIGTINPDDVGITTTAPTRVGNAGPATIAITGGGFAPGTTAKLTRAGSAGRTGVITSGPDRQSKLAVRFDMRGAAEGAWLLTVTAPSGVSATTAITVQNSAPALYATLGVPAQLRYGWVGRATLTLRNAGANDVGIDLVRFAGRSLKVRAIGTTGFDTSVELSGDDLGDAAVLPALSTRTVQVEIESDTLVGHQFMGVDAEVYPAGYLSQTVKGSDPDPGAGSIAGQVTNATGAAVRGLRVTAFDGSHSASSTTDGSGKYVLASLKPGTYRVEAGGARASVAVDENARGADLVTGVADISGTVGKGDATVALLRAGKAVDTIQADATGGFRFRVVKPGAYTLVADSPAAGRAGRALTVAAGVDQPGLSLAFGTRTLTVTAVAGALVRVWAAGEQDLASERTAGANGVATFAGMPPGELTVEARADGKAPARATTSANAVAVTPGTAVALTGRVTAGAAPVAGAVLTTGESFAVTGADGRYSLPSLAAGAHDVWVLATGFAPQVKRGATGSADFAVVTGGETLTVSTSAKRLGTVVRVVDPATGVIVASAVTGQGAASAQLGPLPVGTYSVEADGAVAGPATLGGGAPKAARSAAPDGTIELDEDGYPVYKEDPPAEEEYVDPWSQLKPPARNRKDELAWDHVQKDYAQPCPTADRLYDQLLALKKRKLVAFQRWEETYAAIQEAGAADVNLYLAKSALFAANAYAAGQLMIAAPAGISATLAGVMVTGANYLGTASQVFQGGDALGAIDAAAGLNDLINTVSTALGEGATKAGNAAAIGWLTNTLSLLKSAKELYDDTAKFSEEVRSRGQNYLDAQGLYQRTILQINDLLRAYADAKTHCPDPTDPGPKPPVTPSGTVENITSNDPNEIYGPKGAGPEGWIPRSMALNYSIRFENVGPGSKSNPDNLPVASAPATVVKVVTDLSPAVDVGQVTLGGFGWGAMELDVPAGRTTYHTDVPLAGGDFVRVDGAVDKVARRITWTLATIDPATGEIDGSPTAGFLPPEDGKGVGQGHVDYLAGTGESVAQGAAITAKATITFDANAPIQTNTHTNTVDGVAPTASLTLGTPSCDGKLPVAWTGTDTGSGVAAYDVEVSADGAKTWSRWVSGAAALSGTYPGMPGRTYAFRVMARDAVGNAQAAAIAPYPAKTLDACDLVAPRTTVTVPGGAVGGWYGGPVDLKLDAVDAPGGSGVATLRYAGKQVPGATATERVSAEGVTDFTFSAVDAKGNAEETGHLPIRIDTAAPAIAGTDGAAYTVGQAATPDATCADAGSGIATCALPAGVDTSAAGTFSYTVNATDKLGHTASRTFAYTVSAAPVQQPGQSTPVPAPTPAPTPAPPAGPRFGAKPVTVKLGKITRTSAVVTLTSKEAFAFTGKATLLTTAKQPKVRSKAASFSLANSKSAKVTLKLKPALKKGKAVKLVLRLELKSGVAFKTVDVKVTLRAR